MKAAACTPLTPSCRFTNVDPSAPPTLTPGFVAAIEFIILERARSVRTRRREEYRAWKSRVRAAAKLNASGEFLPAARLTIVFLCARALADVDNVIKPIQDALVGIAYQDDVMVTDVESHRRRLSDVPDLARIPRLLRDSWLAGRECVYVRVENAPALEEML